MTLTTLQERFVDEYISRPANAAQAYITAGGAPKSAKISACKLLKHPKVQEALDRQQERLRSEFSVSRECIYVELRGVIDDPETSTMEMLRAIDMLCRMFGLYNQSTASRDESISNSTTSLVLQGMTDKELQDLITTPGKNLMQNANCNAENRSACRSIFGVLTLGASY